MPDRNRQNQNDQAADYLGRPLRRGWTTGACATAAARAAWEALLTGEFPDPVTIRLPRGQTPAFPLARHSLGSDWAEAWIIKDAGDDPDITHGAEIGVRLHRGASGSGVVFRAGQGVGKITLPGLPLPVGEPAINPVPREMMRSELATVSEAFGQPCDVVVTIGVKGGEALANKTWNPRLGIMGGLSILGTTGIVVPYSCAAWIHSIHRGIDVARAADVKHIVGSTGNTSEETARRHYQLPEIAMIDMGDFAGGMLKYLRKHPIRRVTIAGGFAKLAKLAQGALDLHSSRSEVDFQFLAELSDHAGGSPDLANKIRSCNTAVQAMEVARQEQIFLGPLVGKRALHTANSVLSDALVSANILVVDRKGNILADTCIED